MTIQSWGPQAAPPPFPEIGERIYTTSRFQMDLPEFADAVDVRVLDAAYEVLDLNAAHLQLGYDQNVFLPNPTTLTPGGISFGSPAKRIRHSTQQNTLFLESDGDIALLANTYSTNWINGLWDEATGGWVPQDPLRITQRLVLADTPYMGPGGFYYESSDVVGSTATTSKFSVTPTGNGDLLGAIMAGAYDVRSIMPEAASPPPSVLFGLIAGQTRFRTWNTTDVLAAVSQLWGVNADNGVQTTPDRNIRVGPAGILHFIAPNGNRHHGLRALASGGGVEFLRSDLALVTATISDGGDLTTAQSVVLGSSTIFFEASRQLMIRYRSDLGALEAPYGNGLYAPAFHASTVVDAPTINASSTMSAAAWLASPTHYLGATASGIYIQDAGGGAIRYMATGVHSFEGSGQVNCTNFALVSSAQPGKPVYVLGSAGPGNLGYWYDAALLGGAGGLHVYNGKLAGGINEDLIWNVASLGFNSNAPTIPANPGTGWWVIYLTNSYVEPRNNNAGGVTQLIVGGVLVVWQEWGNPQPGGGMDGFGWDGMVAAGTPLRINRGGPGGQYASSHPNEKLCLIYCGPNAPTRATSTRVRVDANGDPVFTADGSVIVDTIWYDENNEPHEGLPPAEWGEDELPA